MNSSTGNEEETTEEEKWTLSKMFEETNTWIRGIGLPQMMKPTSLGMQYDFPNDVTSLRSTRIGELSLQLTAYYTYTLQLLGKEESELGSFEEVYEIKLGLAMAEEESKSTSKLVKEILRAKAIANNEELNRLHKALLSRRHRLKMLETQSKIYHEQLVRLSREQSRRDSEAKITNGFA